MRKPGIPSCLLVALVCLPVTSSFTQDGTTAGFEGRDEGQQLLAKITQRYGGEAKLRSLRSLRIKGMSYEASSGKEKQGFPVDQIYLLPDHSYVEVYFPTRFISVYSPTLAFGVGTDGKLTTYPESMKRRMLTGFKSEWRNVLANSSQPGYSFTARGSALVGTVAARILEVDVDEHRVRWYVDPESGLILRYVRQQVGESSTVEILTDLSDWRVLDGHLFPFSVSVRTRDTVRGLETVQRFQVTEVQINPPVDMRLFQSPPGVTLASIPILPAVTRDLAPLPVVPSGPPPFTLQDVVDMLRGEMAPARIAILVQERGVSFALADAIEKQIRDAGGDTELLFAIAKAKK